jgi:hypothetical protein
MECVVIQLCKRSVERLGLGTNQLVRALRGEDHEVQMKDCLGRCVPCQAGQLVGAVGGMPVTTPDAKQFLAMAAELSANE